MTDETQLSPPEDEISLLDLLLVLAENARLLVIGPLLVGLAALGFTFAMTPIYTATTTILPPQQQLSVGFLSWQLGALAGPAGLAGQAFKDPADMYVAFIKSRTVADRIYDRFYRKQANEAELPEHAKLAARIPKVTARKDGLIAIEMDDEDPKRAADIANAYVEEYSRLTDGLAVTEARQRRVFFESELRAAQENLKKAQFALSEVGVPESLIKSSPAAVLEGVARLRGLVTVREIKLSTMRAYLTEQSPEFQLAQRELSALRTQLAQAERDQPAGGSRGNEYLNRFREFKYQETIFELLAKQYQSARLDEAREGAIIQVVDKAVPPEFRSRPKRALIALLATLATGILLVVAAFVRESVRNARNSPESANKLARIAHALRGLVSRKQK